MTSHPRTLQHLAIAFVALVLLVQLANLTADAIGAGIGNATTTMEGK